MKKNSQIFTLCLIVFCVELGKSVPTFGNEFVHIKVHVPNEVDAHVHHDLPAYKVVTHHYHRRRRPSKIGALANSKHNALLESVILSEVNKPTISSDHLDYIKHGGEIAEHIAKPVDTYVVKEEHVRPKKVNTYTVVEETKHIHENHHNDPAHDHADQHSYNHEEAYVDTFKVIDTKPAYHSNAAENYHYSSHGSAPRIETFKVVDQHTQDHHYKRKRPHIDTVKITQSHAHTHYDNKHVYDEDNDDANHYHAAGSIESEVAPNHAYDHHQHHHSHYSAPTRAQSDSIEIVKTKAPVFSTSYHKEHHHDDGTYLQVKPDGGFHYARPATHSDSHQHFKDGYSTPFESKPKYPESQQYEHDNNDDIAYALEQEQYLPADSFIPAKIANSQSSYNSHEHVKQNTLFDDEALRTKTGSVGSDVSHGYQYDSPKSSVDAEWPSHGNGYKAAETYTGVDSYSVGHVQGVGSGGYSYPSPYP